MIKKSIYIFSILFLGYGCTSNDKIIEPQKMKLVMWDMITADEYNKLIVAKDSSFVIQKHNISLYNNIFALHKISKQQFYNSYQYYQSHPNEMKILLDSIAAFGIKKRDSSANRLVK